jgi:glutaredoxin
MSEEIDMTYKLFTSKDCGFCSSAKRCLEKKGIEFEEINVDTPEGSAKADKLGITHIPSLTKGHKIVDIKNCV